MLTPIQVTALRDDIARRIAEIEEAPVQDEGDVPEDRAERAGRLRLAADVLTTVLIG